MSSSVFSSGFSGYIRVRPPEPKKERCKDEASRSEKEDTENKRSLEEAIRSDCSGLRVAITILGEMRKEIDRERSLERTPMRGTAFKLYAKSVSGEEILVGWHYQSRSWTDDQVRLLTKLGIETRIEEYDTEYADEG